VIRAFRGLRPAPGRAADVLAPPYDVVSAEEARARAGGRPWSFLRVSRPEIGLPEGADPYSAAAYRQAADTFARMRAEGVLAQDQAPCYYIYRLTQGAHSQRGVVAVASVEAYETGRIRRHELTRPEKEDDRVRHIEALSAQTGPALLTYRRDAPIDALVEAASAGPAPVDAVADDGVRHQVWVVSDPGQVAALGAAFEAVGPLYIADGHHRSAAAARVAAARRRAGVPPDDPSGYFLAVIFPDSQMRILPYHRVVRDLGGLAAEALLARLSERFAVAPGEAHTVARAPGEIGLFLPGGWHRLTIRAERVPAEDPVARLDASLLSDHLLAPILGITDLRRDPRVDFVGGVRGVGELERLVRSGAAAAAFALYPTRIADLMTVADQGLLMPPKSTWFEPKLADGLVCHLLT
jgi:uncharacterized protein (DUF1015 family)